MKNLKIPAFVTVVVLTTITLVFWIFFGVYRVFTQTPTPNVPENILAPVNPALDKDTLTKLQSRTFFEEGQIPTIPISTPTPEPTATPEATLTPTASPSATPTATPSATPTGTISP